MYISGTPLLLVKVEVVVPCTYRSVPIHDIIDEGCCESMSIPPLYSFDEPALQLKKASLGAKLDD